MLACRTTCLPTGNIAIANAEAAPLVTTTPLKRKAQADSQDSSNTSKRACPSRRDGHRNAHCAPRYASYDAPEAGSLADIMRKNCRDRLYLPPVLWTQKHLTHLGCKVVAEELPKSTRSGHSKPLALQVSRGGRATVKVINNTHQWAVRAVERLCKSCVVEARASAVQDILAACNMHISRSSSPSLYFGPTAIELSVHAAFASEPGSSSSVAYIDIELLRLRREDYVRRRYAPRIVEEENKTRDNSPVCELIQKKVRRAQPKDQLEDPYVVAILIALAQHQYRRAQGLSDRPMLSRLRGKGEGRRSGASAALLTAHKARERPPAEPFKVSQTILRREDL
ncbi:hypothetical protein Purlil1_12696 [Purpureocillium lilacinum]|uniref:Uncharacterized protein n=1 Tax=Purpureocillium lilacinum TaxID=33203 RepID=A0ABR0BG64_PURLI|nr:hypothetical protein Purlil1_12696 [Purpureocillium lilacinum]